MSISNRRPGRGAITIALAIAAVTLVAAERSVVAGAGPAGSGGGLVTPLGAGLRVTPTRVVLEGRKRSAELVIANPGTATALVRIELVRMRMGDDGGMSEIADSLPGEAFADPWVRFSPRQVELEPGASQVVRLRVEKPQGLAAGEYRSHLVIRIVPSGEEAAPDPVGAHPTGSLAIGLRPVYGVAVPVIVREGVTQARATLSDFSFVAADPAGPSVLRLRIARSGSRSIYGNLKVRALDAEGRGHTVGELRGVAVYVPNALRTVGVPLGLAREAVRTGAQLKVVYEDPLSGAPFAEALFVVP